MWFSLGLGNSLHSGQSVKKLSVTQVRDSVFTEHLAQIMILTYCKPVAFLA